jgi:hypothetical protein
LRLVIGISSVGFANNQPGFPGQAWLLSVAAPVGEKVDNRQQNDGAQEGDEHCGNSDGIIDRPNFENRAEEVTCQESANYGHNNIDDQVRPVTHNFRGDPPDNSGNNQID